MKTFIRSIALVYASATAFSIGASATAISPGSGAVPATNAITVTNDGTVSSITGMVQAGGATAQYSEYVVNDQSNPFGMDDLTYLLTVSSSAGSTDITSVSLADGFGSLAVVNAGYIAGGGEGGDDVPTKVAENANGVVQFRFPGTDAITAGSGTEYLVIQTGFTSLPAGTANNGLGTVSIAAAASATPEPGSLLLCATGLIGGALLLNRRRFAADPKLNPHMN